MPDPAALLRIASMTQAMLQEAHETELDDAGRHRLSDIHARALEVVRDAVPDDLWHELDRFALPLPESESSEAELRIAQAALIGWLNGVLLGIQASAYRQSQAATEEQRRTLLDGLLTDDPQRRGAYL
jgi:hypothetical protein